MLDKYYFLCHLITALCKLFALGFILAFVFAMVKFSGSLHSLWLLLLIFFVDCIPEIKR